MSESLRGKCVEWVWSNEMKVLIAIWLIIMITGCSAIYKKYNIAEDNVAEEAIEEVIRAKTGIDFDLTPSSPEH